MDQHCRWSTIDVINFSDFNHLIFFSERMVGSWRSIVSYTEPATSIFSFLFSSSSFLFFIILINYYQKKKKTKTIKNPIIHAFSILFPLQILLQEQRKTSRNLRHTPRKLSSLLTLFLLLLKVHNLSKTTPTKEKKKPAKFWLIGGDDGIRWITSNWVLSYPQLNLWIS